MTMANIEKFNKNLLSKFSILFVERNYSESSMLRVRFTYERQRSNDRSTGISYNLKDKWNSKKQCFENNDYLNELLARDRHKIERIFLKERKPTATSIMAIYTGEKKQNKSWNPELEINKHLDEETMKKIESYQFNEGLQVWVDVYIILQRTAMNYTDYKVMDFKEAIKKNTQGNEYLEFFRAKTSQKSIVPLSPTLKKVLEKYDYNPPRKSRSHLNKRLKEVAKELGINEFSVKWGRKTLTNLLLEKGVSVEVAARVLGHSGTTMVQKHYGRIKEKRVIGEIGGIL